MIDELVAVLAHPERYVVAWHEGELHIRALHTPADGQLADEARRCRASGAREEDEPLIRTPQFPPPNI